MMTIVNDMLDHAKDDHPNEACGLVVANGDQQHLIRAKNVHQDPRRKFEIDGAAWLEVADDEEVVGIYHSHPDGSSEPSLADRSMCEATGMLWHIVSYPQCGYTVVKPVGFKAPLLDRPYVHGIHDCYSIVKDWYEREWQIELPDFERQDEWWTRGENLYLDNFSKCGFKELPPDTEPIVGDAFLIQIGTPRSRDLRPNHAAVYVGNGMIIHHPRGRLSTLDVYGGMWSRFTVFHLRHESRMTDG